MAMFLPALRPAALHASAEPFLVRVRVADKDGKPIEGATGNVPGYPGTAVTGTNGECEVLARFPATVVRGRSGTMRLYGVMKVTADGYQIWERSFASLFGGEYDSYSQDSIVTQAVVMAK